MSSRFYLLLAVLLLFVLAHVFAVEKLNAMHGTAPQPPVLDRLVD